MIKRRILIALGALLALGRLHASSLAPVAPAPPPEWSSASSGDLGPTGGQTSFDFIIKGHLYRVRQNGDINFYIVQMVSTQAVTGVSLRVWRKDGSTYDLVSESAAETSISTGINQIPIATPIAAQVGDYLGVRVTYSAAASAVYNTVPAKRADEQDNETVFTYSVSNASPGTDYDWESQTSTSNFVPALIAYMDPPDVVFLGDSITSGHFESHSFVDPLAVAFCGTCTYASAVALEQSISYQTIALSGRTTTDLIDLYHSYVEPLQPKYVSLLAGINDINTDVSTNTVVANLTTLLDLIVEGGQIPVLIGILPEAPWTSDATYWRAIDAVNAAIEPIVEGSPYNGYYIDISSMGKFYSGGDPGNLWQLRDGYASSTDPVHLSTIGQMALADIINDQMTFVPATPPDPGTNTGTMTGGTTYTSGLYTVHVFTSSGTLTVDGTFEDVSVLVIGGGAGGGAYFGGGGGAGGYIEESTSIGSGSYAVVVGSGGIGGNPTSPNSGLSGGNSSFFGYTAYGGGPGAYAALGGDGGSGGGGGSTGASGLAGGAGVAGQGFGGGTAGTSGAGYPAGGGGGASEAGENFATNNAGDGGDGIQSIISGTPTYYAGGGGGGPRTGTAGAGGLGGGGNGGAGGAGSNNGQNGTPNTGGGGGGGGGEGADASGGTGGTGIVIVRYLTPSDDPPPDPGTSSGGVNNYPFSRGIKSPFHWR